jgi:Flp pilus assembly secretin CpaC
MDAASEQSWSFGVAAGPASAVVLPPLPAPPPPSTLDIWPLEPAPALRASAALVIDPLTPPRAAVPQLSPDLPGLPYAAPPESPVPRNVAVSAAGADRNVGPFEVVDNSHELVVLLGRSKHLRTKTDVVEAESVDPSICEVQLPTDRDLTIAGRTPGLTRVMVRLEGDSSRPVVLLVRVVPDVSGERGPTVAQTPRPTVPPQVVLRVMVAELDRTAAKTAGIDADPTSSPATMLLRSLPSAAGGNAAVLKNRLTVCLGTRGLQERGVLKIFSEPTVAVVSGRPAKVVVGSQPPGPVTPGSGGSRPNPNEIPLHPTTLKLLATLLTKDRIRLEVTPDPRPREPGAELVRAGLSRPPAASGELRDGQTLAVCGLIDAPKKPPPESPSQFPIFGQWFSKPAPPPPNPTEMLILVTAERLNPADAAPAASPPAASGNARRSASTGDY